MSEIYRTAEGAREVEQRYRDLLGTWPVPSGQLRVPTGQGETHVVVSGPEDAPPLVVLQGSGANAAMLLPTVEKLAEHHRVYAVDVIGEPGLSAPSRPPLDSEAYALWLDDVLDGLGLTTASFLGTSLGGFFAIDYATRRPQRVERLVLLTPAGVGRQKKGVLVKFVLLMPFGEWGRRRSLVSAIGPMPAGSMDQPLIAFTLVVFKHFKPRLGIPVFDDDTLRRLTMPVLAVAGAADKMIDSQATKRRLETVVPHATVHLLPGAGHFLPDRTATVLGFLAGVTPEVRDDS